MCLRSRCSLSSIINAGGFQNLKGARLNCARNYIVYPAEGGFARVIRTLYSLLPSPLRIQGLSFFRNYWIDILDRLNGRLDRSIPPRHLNISGEGPFRTFGKNTVDLCRQLAGLTPSDCVIDIGCGIGRTALALTGFLETGSYYGFDVIPFAVDWCRQHVSKHYPHFHFTHADIFNCTYNPRGKIAPEVFRFPYENDAGSFALATSLFTHVLPATAENYLREAARVLQSNSYFLSTWFLLDRQMDESIKRGERENRFPHQFEHHSQATLHAPELAVAFPRDYVIELFHNSGFAVVSVYRGDWTGNPDKIDSMQDVIIARKR